jgi:hypothetical protein
MQGPNITEYIFVVNSEAIFKVLSNLRKLRCSGQARCLCIHMYSYIRIRIQAHPTISYGRHTEEIFRRLQDKLGAKNVFFELSILIKDS